MDNRIKELAETARLLRLDVVRMIHLAGDGHPGPSLAVADIVAATAMVIAETAGLVQQG